jgi:phosphatidylserine/phosphatidylglycerophosphate/cardiolipin synthase-like enzyme
MRNGFRLRVAGLILLVSAGLLLARERAKTPEGPRPAVTDEFVSIYFSPKGGCEAAVVEQIHAAKRSLDLQAYSFTSTKIAEAIAEAHERGVKVRAVLDRQASGNQYSGATYLFSHQVPTWLDGEHPIAHNKVIIIDGQTVITGSFNFTRQAENSNAENLAIMQGRPKIAEAYTRNFEQHLGHARKYEGVK